MGSSYLFNKLPSQAFPFILPNRKGWLLQDISWFCNVWGVLWYCAALMTIFLVAVLSITRTICITFPFANSYITKGKLVAVVGSYLIFIVIQSTIPYWVGEKYHYYYMPVICQWTTRDTLGDHPPELAEIYAHIHAFEQYFVILPVLISCAVSLWVLSHRSGRSSSYNRTGTVTIICFTGLYVTCNIPPCAIYVTKLLNIYLELNLDFSWDMPSFYFLIFFSSLSIAINSALNPLVYFWRIATFRQHVMATVRCNPHLRPATSRGNLRTSPTNTIRFKSSTYVPNGLMSPSSLSMGPMMTTPSMGPRSAEMNGVRSCSGADFTDIGQAGRPLCRSPTTATSTSTISQGSGGTSRQVSIAEERSRE